MMKHNSVIPSANKKSEDLSFIGARISCYPCEKPGFLANSLALLGTRLEPINRIR